MTSDVYHLDEEEEEVEETSPELEEDIEEEILQEYSDILDEMYTDMDGTECVAHLKWN